jgi:hypothetical protein
MLTVVSERSKVQRIWSRLYISISRYACEEASFLRRRPPPTTREMRARARPRIPKTARSPQVLDVTRLKLCAPARARAVFRVRGHSKSFAVNGLYGAGPRNTYSAAFCFSKIRGRAGAHNLSRVTSRTCGDRAHKKRRGRARARTT